MNPKKSLRQHWLKDPAILKAVVDAADVNTVDTVLEIGPGLGTLTKVLLGRAGNVVAVEKDEQLAEQLKININSPKLQLVTGDILEFDLTQLPAGYKVVANIPYYLTANLLRTFSGSANPPSTMSLLVQKEVAERIAASPGQMSLLAISVQLYYLPKLHQVVSAEMFTPPPKVDSQIISLTRRPEPLFDKLDDKLFFRLVKAGFSERRKKLRGSLAGGLHISKAEADELLAKAGVDGDARAQELDLEQWYKTYQLIKKSCTLSADT